RSRAVGQTEKLPPTSVATTDPLRPWLSLNSPSESVIVCVPPCGSAVVMVTLPCRASMIAPKGSCRSPLRGTKRFDPGSCTSTGAQTSRTLLLTPSFGGGTDGRGCVTTVGTTTKALVGGGLKLPDPVSGGGGGGS